VAQERNEMNASPSETDEIRGEIERTRVEMSGTIGEIQDRLRPDHLIQQAKDGVREAATGKVKNIMHSASETAQSAAIKARGAGNHLAWYAKEHPIRIAITAGVVTWWLLRGRGANSAEQWYGASETMWDHDEYGAVDPSLRDRVGGVASTARETVGEYASTARQAVGTAAATARETVGEYAASARDTVNEYAASAASTAKTASRRVASTARTATSSANDWACENPLAAGALAVAVGAAIGLAVRGTEYENRAMGTTRDQALAKAKNVANNLKQNVTDKVVTYAETVVGESLADANTAPPPMGSA
jgi:ElaB/YqjD/DUF883 family membrane-anchored ribosome-binding protein/uncharacterized protein YjbJ (UPF0337 family)